MFRKNKEKKVKKNVGVFLFLFLFLTLVVKDYTEGKMLLHNVYFSVYLTSFLNS